MSHFKLISDYTPSSDQTKAIELLSQGITEGLRAQTLLGVTGSGKTYTMAKVIEEVQKPTLVLTHNKTLAAQLYREFAEFFPHNAVEYFVSYYDYYQPEAYVASSDLYIEKDASINDEIDRLRLKATFSILDRSDTIVVSSVSCIYGLGSPEQFEKRHLRIRSGDTLDRDEFLRTLVGIYYERNDIAFTRGTFRVRGDSVEIIPAYLKNEAYRVEFFGDTVESITQINPLSGSLQKKLDQCYIYPAKHFVSDPDEMVVTLELIAMELEERCSSLRATGKLVEAQRLESRTRYDMEMLAEMGYCNGIENYSRIVSRRKAGERPECLIDYFHDNFLLIIDESHVTLPQVRGMYNGDRARKESLVEYGFRLPSALDNRPLRFEEFEKIINQVVYVSATPGDYEIKDSARVVEQVIRPTGLLDPEIEIRSAKNQVDDITREIRERAEKNERVLVTTLTKKMSEDLAAYLSDAGIKTKYLHSEIETIERVEIIRDLRKGEFDCLVGINLLREGLDIPEVSLVAIFDADKEGFLRSTTSLIQTAGRAARNLNGKVIMYADTITDSMRFTIDETERRRKIQHEYNITQGITPKSIYREIRDIIEREYQEENRTVSLAADYIREYRRDSPNDLKALRERLKGDMLESADRLDFEKAAMLRDQMLEIDRKLEMLEKIKK